MVVNPTHSYVEISPEEADFLERILTREVRRAQERLKAAYDLENPFIIAEYEKDLATATKLLSKAVLNA